MVREEGKQTKTVKEGERTLNWGKKKGRTQWKGNRPQSRENLEPETNVFQPAERSVAWAKGKSSKSREEGRGKGEKACDQEACGTGVECPAGLNEVMCSTP